MCVCLHAKLSTFEGSRPHSGRAVKRCDGLRWKIFGRMDRRAAAAAGREPLGVTEGHLLDGAPTLILPAAPDASHRHDICGLTNIWLAPAHPALPNPSMARRCGGRSR